MAGPGPADIGDIVAHRLEQFFDPRRVSFVAADHEGQGAISGPLGAARHGRLHKGHARSIGRIMEFTSVGDADRGTVHHNGVLADVGEHAVLCRQDLFDVGARGQHREDGVGASASFGDGIRDRDSEGAGLSARLFVDIEAADRVASAAHVIGHRTAHQAKADPRNGCHRISPSHYNSS